MLASMGIKEAAELAQQFPGVNIVISADKARSNITPSVFGSALVTQTANRGRYLGLLTIAWNGGPWQKKGSDRRQELTRKDTLLSNRINRLQTAPNQSAGTLSKVEKLESEREQIRQQIREVEIAQNRVQAQNNESIYSHTFIALTRTGRTDPKIKAILQEARKKVKEIGSK